MFGQIAVARRSAAYFLYVVSERHKVTVESRDHERKVIDLTLAIHPT
jgi:hypothetical protein